MRILHVLYESKGDYFGVGGVTTRAYEIYGKLKERHDITLLCKRYPGAQDRDIEGLRHIFVGAESKSLTISLLSYAFSSANYVRRHGDEYDIIIEEFSPAIPTFLHAFTGRPLVLQVQGYTGNIYYRKYNPVYALILYIMEHFRPVFYRYFICVDPNTVNKLFWWTALRNPAQSSSNVPDHSSSGRNEFAVIPNAVSADLLDLPVDEDRYLLYFGRIDIYSKGLDTLLDGYMEFCRQLPGIRLVIAGDGRDMNKLKKMLIGLPDDIRGKIELLGWVTGEKKKEVMSKAMFVVFPSRHEVQSIAALEAMASGKPVVVSDIPELGYAVKCGAGIGFRTGDSRSLSEAMLKMAASDRRKEMGQRGREWVRDFTWDRIALKFEEFIEEVAAKARTINHR